MTDDVDPQRFKADTMAKVLSMEQQYWCLAQAHVQLDAARKSVEVAEEILKREQADLAVGRGTAADIAEATQSARAVQPRPRHANLRCDHDGATASRLLGLPSADNRRIVPVTAPIEAQLQPDWDATMAAMLENQPEIVQAKARVKQAEAEKAGTVAGRLARIESQKDCPPDGCQAAYSLARPVFPGDRRQLQAIPDSKTAQGGRRPPARCPACLLQGRPNHDRPLPRRRQPIRPRQSRRKPSTRRHTTSRSSRSKRPRERSWTTTRSPSLMVLGGRSPPRPCLGPHPHPRPAADRRRLSLPANRPPPARLTAHEPRPNAAAPKGDASAGKTFSFDLTVGIGSTPVQIRGSFTITPAPSAAAPDVR